MNDISHKQAIQWTHRRLDGLLNESQLLLLDEHLGSCDSCRAESESLASLTARLQSGFHNRWDKQNGPSTNVMANVHSQTRRIMVMNRINTGLRAVGGAVAFLVIILLFSSVIQKTQTQSTTTSTQASVTGQFPSLGTNKSNGEWIAFISGEYVSAGNEKLEVYMIHPDGSGLINLTNSPANYYYLQWSPNGDNFIFLRTSGTAEIMGANQNGAYLITDTNFDSSNIYGALYSWSPNSKQIAFINNRSGNYDIYTVYADGRNDTQLKQLTNDPGQDGGFVWSPDGGQIAFQRLDGKKLSVYIMNMDGSNQREVARGSGKVNLRWSLDGTSIYASSTENNWLECEACVAKPAIYHIDLEGQSVRQIYAEQDASKFQGGYFYDTPQNTLYFLRIDSPSFLGIWGTWFSTDGNATSEIGKMDPHQTCKTTTGNIVNEHISPNERFSIISNFCAGSFDLYLADRETPNPKQKLIHLLRLPFTLGQGGDNAYLPIRWSPDGRWLIYDNGQAAIYLLNIEKAMQDPTTEPSILFQSESILFESTEFAWQPRDYDDSAIEPKPSPQASDRLLAFTKETDGNFDIYTMHADGNGLTNLTNNPARDTNPIWSPDGKHIAFESNRNGFMQIYLMDADGSNLIQFTNDKADHSLPLNIDGKSNPWSPDGSKFLFLQNSSGGEIGNLYVKGIDGENQVLLGTGTFSHNDLSWSPNGTYIAYVLNESPNPNETFVTGIYVVDSHGNNSYELKKLIPQNENLGAPYYWSSDGQSIVFIAGKNDGLGQAVYEFDLETNTLLQKDMLKQGVIDWQDEISLIMDIEKAELSFVWQRSDGTSNTLDWGDSNCLLDVTRSLHGNFAIGAYCPDSKKFKLYWANSDGSMIRQLLDSSTLIGQLWDIAWSPDDQYIAFNMISDKTSMYIVNIKDALQDSSIQPTQMVIGSAELYTIPSWQPIP